MSVRPSKLRKGARLRFVNGPSDYEVEFIKRVPAQGKGHPAVNYVRNEDWVGLDGLDDMGICPVSDYDLSRKYQLIGA